MTGWPSAWRVAGLLALSLAATIDAAGASAARPAAPIHSVAAPTTVPALSDGRLLASADPALRDAGIRVAHLAGARIARIPIGWSTVMRDLRLVSPPEDAAALSDPAHPSYDWSRIDAAVRDLAAADLTPLVYFTAAPPWALSAPRYPYARGGTWAPRPAALAAFASAAARRFDGTYPDPLTPTQALPRVRHFQTWNEPNLARYLQPQWVGRPNGGAQLFSPRWYRRMHAAAYAAIRSRQPQALVGLAGLAPTGDHTQGASRVAPMRFLRALLCLDPGAKACGPPLAFDAVSAHPLSTTDPDRPAKGADDVSVADVGPKIEAVLARARRLGRLAGPVDPALWITELNWTSADAGGVPAAKQSAVIGRAFMRLHQAGATIVGWQFATDPPVALTGGVERPAGLTVPNAHDSRRTPGQPKRFLGGFRFPAAAIAVGSHRAYVWTQPPAEAALAAGAAVRVERRIGSSHAGRWRRAGRLEVGSDGTASGLLGLPEEATLRFVAGREVSGSVRVQLRLGRVRVDAGNPSRAALGARLQTSLAPHPADGRPTDPDGPGAFPSLPPLFPGGAPPTADGRPVLPIPLRSRTARRLTFVGTPGRDVLVGTSGDDHLSGLAGDDVLIGLGGDDRFDRARGSDTVVDSRRVDPN